MAKLARDACLLLHIEDQVSVRDVWPGVSEGVRHPKAVAEHLHDRPKLLQAHPVPDAVLAEVASLDELTPGDRFASGATWPDYRFVAGAGSGVAVDPAPQRRWLDAQQTCGLAHRVDLTLEYNEA